MRFRFVTMAAASPSLLNMAVCLADEVAASKTLGVVTITGTRPTSLRTQIPTTMEGINKEQIARRINATDSEDALKYLPSLLVRKRYIGDYNHAVLSSRASGAGNSAHQESASLGDRNDNASWWLDFDHTDSHGQPLTFTTKLLSAGTAGTAGTAVAGAVLDADRSFNPWYILGTDTEYRTIQDHAKFKVAYEFTPTLRASYLLGWWQNDSTGRPLSFLRDAAGNSIYTGTINVGGRSFTLAPTEFNLTNETLQHFMHGLSLKRSTGGVWDWELAASCFDYQRDALRTATVGPPERAPSMCRTAGTSRRAGRRCWARATSTGMRTMASPAPAAVP